MAKVIVYDEYTNRLFTYNLSENDPMPYAYGNTMRVREFRGSSNSPTLWTTTRAMEAWNLTRRRYGKGIYIGYAFQRLWEGGHGKRGACGPARREPDGGRHLRLQHLEKADGGQRGHRPHPHSHRLSRRTKIPGFGNAKTGDFLNTARN